MSERPFSICLMGKLTMWSCYCQARAVEDEGQKVRSSSQEEDTVGQKLDDKLQKRTPLEERVQTLETICPSESHQQCAWF